MVVIHNGIRYHDDDAKALGLRAAKREERTEAKAAEAETNKAETKPARSRNKAATAKNTKGE